MCEVDMDVEEPIDLDRVISDQKYRRDVIEYLNRRATNASPHTDSPSFHSAEDGFVAPIRSFDGRLTIVQDKP